MQGRKKIVLTVALALALALAAVSGLPAPVFSNLSAGETEDGVIEQTLLRDAEPFERGEIALELAREHGMDAVPALVRLVERHQEYEDKHFIVSCIVALTRISPDPGDLAESAARALAGVIDDAAPAGIRYSAARALGHILEGKSEIYDDEFIKEINTTLLTYMVETKGAELYAPSMALFRINDDRMDFSGGQTNPLRWATSLEPGDLADNIYNTFSEHPDRLKALEEQPWPLLIRTYVDAPDSDEGRTALNLLTQQKPLEGVDSLFDRLHTTDTEDASWPRMAVLMGELSGIEPDNPEAVRPDEVGTFLNRWRSKWHEELKTRKDEKHRHYAWRSLEKAIHSAKFEAYPESFELLDTIKKVVLYQYDSPEQIPPHASETSKNLIRDTLSLKSEFTGAKEDLTETETPETRVRIVRSLLEMARSPKGEKISSFFIEDFAGIAGLEEDTNVLFELSRLLSVIGGEPITLEEEKGARAETLENWVNKIER